MGSIGAGENMKKFPALLRILCPSLALSWLLATPAISASCTGVFVSNTAQLHAALMQAHAQTTIALAPGAYQPLHLAGRKWPSGGVRICSADPTRPARLRGLKLNRVAGMVLEGVVLDHHAAPGERPATTMPFRIENAQDITLRNMIIDGDLAQGVGPHADGYPTAKGLYFAFSTRITIEDSIFRRWFKALILRESRDITVRGNEFHDIRVDGMNLVQVENVLITQNHFHDFTRSLKAGDHADMIQIWTKGTKTPSRNLSIHANIFDSGHGAYTQTIFIRNKEVDTNGAGPKMFYQNFNISQNVIINAHTHGITIGASDGLVIENNTLIPSRHSRADLQSPKVFIPAIRIDPRSRNVSVSRNLTPRIIGCIPRYHQCAQNALLQDTAPTRPNYLPKLFRGPLGQGPAPLRNYRYNRDNDLFDRNIGADLLRD